MTDPTQPPDWFELADPFTARTETSHVDPQFKGNLGCSHE